MTEKDWEEFGRMLGEGIAKGIACLSPRFATAIREHYRATFGECSRCHAPLAGHSPSKLCTGCHAAIVLEKARGAEPPAEA